MVDNNDNPYQSPTPVEPEDEYRDSIFVMSGCLTVEDALSTQRLASPATRQRVVLLVWLASFLSFLLISFTLFSSQPFGLQLSNLLLFVACLLLPGIALFPLLIDVFKFGRLSRQELETQSSTHSTFSPTGISMKTENGNVNASFEWSQFSNCVANDTVALVFFENSHQWVLLTRNTLRRPDRWEALIEMIESQLPVSRGLGS